MPLKERLNEIFGNLFSAENRKKIYFYGGVAVGLVIILFLIVLIVKIVGSKITYAEMEDKLENAAYNYMQKNPHLLPGEISTTYEINGQTLIDEEYIKPLKKYIKDKTCTSKVIVTNEGTKYDYQAYLSCQNFQTTLLLDEVRKNNVTALTGDGLYQIENELVFRGENPNNFVYFAKRLWRIVKIDANNNIYLILQDFKYDKNTDLYRAWDDRYNTEKQSIKGINTYTVSRAVVDLNNIYQSGFEEKDKNYLVPMNLCVGKRFESNVGWESTMECSDQFSNQYIGLLPLYEYMRASLSETCAISDNKQCVNYNYLKNVKDKWWTITANADNTYEAYQIKSTGYIEANECVSKAYLRYVVALDKNVLYEKGTGTETDPYYVR